MFLNIKAGDIDEVFDDADNILEETKNHNEDMIKIHPQIHPL